MTIDEQIVVKVNVAAGDTIDQLATTYPIVVDSAVLASRGIYLVHPSHPQDSANAGKVAAFAGMLAKAHGVVYAEPDLRVHMADTQFYAWPHGLRQSTPGAAWLNQPVAQALQLPAAQQLSTGTGVLVAVLDTGADPNQPALANQLAPGWNHVADNANTDDVATNDPNGDSAVGHGTFVSGLVALVAPNARIMPDKVLDGNGDGSVFIIAEAILDAADAGAKVINLSFGATTQFDSNVLDDAIDQAQRLGAVVVAAAGNDNSGQPHYPANRPNVLSVGALDQADTALASFSNWGPWVAVAAPGSDLIGPMPGGGYATWSGTSMATPLVSGQAALIRAYRPKLSAGPIVNLIDHIAQHLNHVNLHYGAINILDSLQKAPPQ